VKTSDDPHYSAWATLLPRGWQTGRLKEFAQVHMSNVDKKTVLGEKEVLLCNYVDVYYNDMIAPDIEFMPATATDDQIKRFSLLGGDVLITKDSESWDDIAIPAFVPQDLPGVLCGYHLAHIRPGPELDGAFLARAFTAAGIRDQLRVAANGITRFGLPADAVSDAVFPVPPIKTQRSIAAFLDRKTAEIDALVAKKEQLIELLEEKRTALITHAVTKGLDPDVKMKESGVEWLGGVPAHWEVNPLRWVSLFQRGHDLPSEEREDGEIPVVSSSGPSSTHSRANAEAPGIVTGRYGTIGQFHLLTEDYWPLNTTLYTIELYGNEPRFLRYMLESMAPLFRLNSLKSAVPGIDRNDVHQLLSGVPPVSEQRTIAAFLDQRTANIEALASKIRGAISYLVEYRSALITASVTGQMTVPDAPAEAA
jgi:type I restriction enzyme S subunit